MISILKFKNIELCVDDIGAVCIIKDSITYKQWKYSRGIRDVKLDTWISNLKYYSESKDKTLLLLANIKTDNYYPLYYWLFADEDLKPFDDEHIDTVFYTNDLKELYDQICETEILNVIDILE